MKANCSENIKYFRKYTVENIATSKIVLWINKLDNHPCTCKMNTHMSAFINAHRHIVPVFLCQGDCLFVSDVAFLTSSLYM